MGIKDLFDINKERPQPPSYKEKKYKTSFRQILSYLLVPFKKMFYVTLAMSILQSMLFLLLPILTGEIITQLVDKQQGFQLLIDNFVLLFVSLLLMAIVAFIRLYTNQFMGNSIIRNLRREIFNSIQKSSYNFLDYHSTGDLMSRCTSDLNTLKQLLSSQITFFIRQCLTVFLALIALFVLNFKLALFIMPFMPVIFFIIYKFKKKIGPVYKESREIYGEELTSNVEENIGGVRVVRAFATEGYEIAEFDKINDKYLEKQKELMKLQVTFDPTVRFLVNIMMAVVIIIGGAILKNDIGTLFSFILLLNFAVDPLYFINTFLGNTAMYNQTSDRIVELLNNENYIKEDPNAITLDKNKVKGAIKFDKVSLSYRKNEFQELKNISFETKPGEVVAILGATGSGKTSIIRLIGRFYEKNSGTISIDGVDINKVTLKSLRQMIGFVPQESFLFSISLKENLMLGRPGKTTMEEIIHACKLANIHNFIDGLPEKYETIVGQRGVTLSGGQRQRLAIARALIKMPKILILDDATSSVDVDTEYAIQKGFKEMFSDCTTFIITQRLSSVRHSDRIIVLDRGEIMQIGSHDDLMSDNHGIYYKLYTTLKVDERAEIK